MDNQNQTQKRIELDLFEEWIDRERRKFHDGTSEFKEFDCFFDVVYEDLFRKIFTSGFNVGFDSACNAMQGFIK